MPRTALCATFMLPHTPKKTIKGATACLVQHSVAHPCTLSDEKSQLRVRHPLVQATQWHIAAPSVTKKQG